MRAFVFISMALAISQAQAAEINATSCSQASVVAAINSSNPGDTVRVPAGTCSWSGGISISGIQLIGAGSSASGTVITAGLTTLTKHATKYTRLSGFRFTGTDQHIQVAGAASAKPYIIDNNYLKCDVNSPKALFLTANGGLLHHNQFTAESATSSDIFNIITNEDWSQAPSIGNADTTGERNIYLEDNTFTKITETGPDGDVGARLVIRHNNYVDASIVIHGGYPNDSSPDGGTRHFEVYNNVFQRVSNSVAINKWVWVRGSSGVIANNTIPRADSPDGTSYSGKPEVKLTVGCPMAYPMQYQVGQTSKTPENPPTRPLAIFGNSGAGVSDSNYIVVEGSQTAGPPCSTPANYIQLGRDYVLSNTWGWTPYTYPHPLQNLSSGGSSPVTLSSPKNLRILP